MSVLKSEIVSEIYKSVEILGGKSDILSIIGSIGDTLDDDEILVYLKSWNRLNSTNDLKSEIETYLLENNFSVVDDVISSDEVFVYVHNLGRILYRIELFLYTNNKFATLNLDSISVDFKIKFIKDFTITSLNDIKFILSHSCGSPLFDESLLS